MSKARKTINLNIPPDLHETVAKQAKLEHRTINNFVEKTLIKATNFKIEA